jgi:hypothetical protein
MAAGGNSFTDNGIATTTGAPPTYSTAHSIKLGSYPSMTLPNYIAGPLEVLSSNNWTNASLIVRGSGSTGVGGIALIRPSGARWASMNFLTGSTIDWSQGTMYFQGINDYDYAIYGGTTYPILAPAGKSLGLTIGNTTSNVGLGRFTQFPNQQLQINNGDIVVNLANPTNLSTAVSATGGTLAAATYTYYVVSTNALGEQTASNYAQAVTTGATSRVTVSWTAAYGATGYKVYRSTIAGIAVYSTQTYIGATTSTSFIDDGITPMAGGMYASTAYINRISANGNSYLNGGNVGIGTYVPDSLLHIESGALTVLGNARSIRLGNSGNSGSRNEIGFGYNVTGATRYQPVVIGHYMDNSGGSGSGTFYVALRASTDSTIAPIERFTILSDGKTGIGTTTPAALLQLRGNDEVLRISGASNGMRYYSIGRASSNGLLTFNGSEGGAFTGYSFLGGKFGIATSSPSADLSIGSSVTASTTIAMGKIQFDGSDSAGTRICTYMTPTGWEIKPGACTQ